MKSLVVITILLLIAVSAVAATPDGAALYKAKCASCHGADGSGQTPMGKSMKLRDLGSPDVQKLTDKQLYDITADGKAKMPAYKSKLSDDDIKALVAHMRTFKK